MTAYRFCRTDDIGFLVDALNRCWAPYFPDEPSLTPAAFKRSIRDLQVWCSSCMVASAGQEPVGVLVGAKRPCGTLVHKIAVHPDHSRQGHARHLLESLGAKLAILGPPRLVAEVPDSNTAACGLFTASGYSEEALLTDYVFERDSSQAAQGAGKLVIPFTVDDLFANGLLAERDPHTCWERSVETLTARKEDIAGLAVADEQIEACILYIRSGREVEGMSPARAAPTLEIVFLKSFVEGGGGALTLLLSRLCAQGIGTLRFPKVHPAEFTQPCLEALGFRAAGRHRLYAATAQPA